MVQSTGQLARLLRQYVLSQILKHDGHVESQGFMILQRVGLLKVPSAQKVSDSFPREERLEHLNIKNSK